MKQIVWLSGIFE